jgi:uncharacterized integral membrane protein (TIGR00698 family)
MSWLKKPGSGKILFYLSSACIIAFNLPPTFSLALGLFIGIFSIQPFPAKTRTFTKYLLQFSVIGLGFGMEIGSVMSAGKDGFLFTILTIVLAMSLGFMIGRFLKVERVISYLISVGTAICGGSAIAAVSQVMDADDKDISVSIGTVFILNAVALFVFPAIGHLAGLGQQQFGLWSAIAIHDTSSVVGAASNYGTEALMTATTVKLARALWIVPLALLTSFIFRRNNSASAFPYFILFFILASAINSYLNIPEKVSHTIVSLAKTGFSLTLFLIGTGISVSKIKQVGARPLLQGVILWLMISVISLWFVLRF